MYFDKEKDKYNENGIDKVKFLVSMNKGGLNGEIHKVSSGGELSRLMLAINLVIANSGNTFQISVDGTASAAITLPAATYTSNGDIAQALQLSLIHI